LAALLLWVWQFLNAKKIYRNFGSASALGKVMIKFELLTEAKQSSTQTEMNYSHKHEDGGYKTDKTRKFEIDKFVS
jgi:hypothetical protein